MLDDQQHQYHLTQDKQSNDRFKRIREKLDCYTKTKNNNEEAQQKSRILQKIEELERSFTKNNHQVEETTQIMKDTIVELKIDIAEKEKKMLILSKKRRQRIFIVKQEVANFFQSSQSIDQLFNEQRSSDIENKIAQLHKLSQHESIERQQCLKKTQLKFEHALPDMAERIITSSSHLQCKIKRVQKDLLLQSVMYSQSINNQRQYQQDSLKNIAIMIEATINQIQSDLNEQRAQRQKIKQKVQCVMDIVSKRFRNS